MEAQAQRLTDKRTKPGVYNADPGVGGSAWAAAAGGSPAGGKCCQMTSGPTVKIRINPTLEHLETSKKKLLFFFQGLNQFSVVRTRTRISHQFFIRGAATEKQ